jgi:hypothetical protein
MHIGFPYHEIYDSLCVLPTQLTLSDHLGGFQQDYTNDIFKVLSSHDCEYRVTWHQVVNDKIRDRYSSLQLGFSPELQDRLNLSHFHDYRQHPEVVFKNFVCSFNGSSHVSRKLLTSILHRFGWYSPVYVSKNFQYNVDILDGHLLDYVEEEKHRVYRKFFIGDASDDFFSTVNSFGHVRFDHADNIYKLQSKLTSSFVNIVSETLATSYYPFVTEKFLFGVVTRSLFLAYAQPEWHDHLERYYGFRKYNKIFDYRFDSIRDPVERLVELMSMIAKFSVLSSDDWRDLYEMESDTIEYNYDHYFSRNYIKQLAKYE